MNCFCFGFTNLYLGCWNMFWHLNAAWHFLIHGVHVFNCSIKRCQGQCWYKVVYSMTWYDIYSIGICRTNHTWMTFIALPSPVFSLHNKTGGLHDGGNQNTNTLRIMKMVKTAATESHKVRLNRPWNTTTEMS